MIGVATTAAPRATTSLATSIFAMVLLASGCGGGSEEKVMTRGTGSGGGASGAKKNEDASAPGSLTAQGSSDVVDSISATGVASDDFIERDTNRDPFRSFVDIFTPKLSGAPQRAVIMPAASIDEMRLIAIVLGGEAGGRAMVVDGSSVGYTLRRGDYLGRPEVVQVGGAEGVPVTLNWRVDRIRENELVISRDDPTSPDRPPLVRVIPLHDERDEEGSLVVSHTGQ